MDMPASQKAGFAFGQPGLPPRWTSSAKDGIGTAHSNASRVWFTLADGIVTEVYYPTIDHPQIRDLQFLVTDGETFFHQEKDLESTVRCIDSTVLGYHVESHDPKGRYRIIKEVIANPSAPCLLVNARIEQLSAGKNPLQCYVLLAPHLEIGGWGNSASKYQAARKDILVAWKDRTNIALGVDTRFARTSCGYVGASDGWQDLHDNFRMDWEFDHAYNGDVAMIGEIELGKNGEFTLGLAFGDGLHAAISVLTQALSVSFEERRKEFCEQWKAARNGVPALEASSGDQGRLYRISYNVLLAHEDKTFPGAWIASVTIPWGEAKGDKDRSGYHLVWTRDLVKAALALAACDNRENPRRALVYLACSQRPDGGFSQNFWINGTPHWTRVQLDEVALPVILAWRLWKSDALGKFDPYPMVQAAAGFLVREGPVTQQERWEEASGFSPSTLATTIAALICAADLARHRRDLSAADFLEEYADFLESNVERWTVTTQGELVPGIPHHYIRILPTPAYDPVPLEDPNAGILYLANQPPGAKNGYPAKDIVDAGFLDLVRFGIRKPHDPLIEDSLRVIDAVLKVDTPLGPCWHRYNHDGYGNRPDGGPYMGWGKGRLWPLLTGERGHYELAAERDATPYLHAMEHFAFGGGMIPEQVWDEDNKSLGMRLGHPSGSAMPLLWSHAEYVSLLRSVRDGEVFDLIGPVADRYSRHNRGRKDLEVWKPLRQVKTVKRGQTLRIMAPAPFLLHWSGNEWQTTTDTQSMDSGTGLHFVDIPIAKGQVQPIRFTFQWQGNADYSFFSRKAGNWEGRNYQVATH